MSSGSVTPIYRNEICIHEAGHAVVLWDVFRELAQHIKHDTSVTPPCGETYWLPLQAPATFPEARAIAAYYEAGRAAIGIGQVKGEVDPGKDPNRGYSDPPGPKSDSGQIQILVLELQKLGWPSGNIQAVLDHGRADARRVVEEQWLKVRTLGSMLETSPAGIVYRSTIATVL